MTTIVDPTADELPLIFDTWATSFRRSPWAGCVPNRSWNRVMREGFADILERPATVCKVAVAPLESGERRVMGYYVAEPARNILHWLYVKKDYRRLAGLGRQLLLHATAQGSREAGSKWRYTYRTDCSARFLGDGFTFDPIPARVK